MLRQRLATTIVVLPILIAAIWFGDIWFTIFLTTAAILSGLEFYRMASHANIQPLVYFGLAWIILLMISVHCPYPAAKPIIITTGIVISLVWLLFRSPREQAFDNWGWTLAGVFYIGWMLSYWTMVRHIEFGREWVFWGMFITFANDTAAYFTGKTWGKHTLAPAISPAKTLEGTIGGFVGTVVCGVGLGLLFKLPITILQTIVLALAISLFAQLGDLIGSLLKRNTGIKDSSKLLPGHGGMLDRADSIIFTGIVIYHYALLMNYGQ